MTMRTSKVSHRSSFRPIRTVGRLALVVCTASLLVGTVLLQAPAGAAAPVATSTSLKAFPGKLDSGEAVAFVATVSDPTSRSVAPVGQVVFTVTSTVDSSTVTCGGAGDTQPVVSKTATCYLGAGLLSSLAPYTVAAAYSDTLNATYGPSSTSLSQGVSPGKTFTSLAASSNPTVSGQPLSFTASVAVLSPANDTPTGSVTFTGVTCDGGNVIAVVAHAAQCTISGGLPSSGSPYKVTAVYGGDPNNSPSKVAKFVQTVNPAGAALALSATPGNCVGMLCTISEGTPIAFTATVNTVGLGGMPTGPVDFSVLPAGSTTSLTCQGGNAQGITGGQAICNFPSGLPADIYYTVKAVLADPNFQPAAATLYENEGLVSTNTTVSGPGTVGAGATFTISAQVTPIGTSAIRPTGFVELEVCGSNSNFGNSCQGGPSAVDPATGQASIVIGGGLSTGGYKLYATYLGDQNFYSSSAKPGGIFVVLSQTVITISSSANAALENTPFTLTAVLSTPNGSSGSGYTGPPTGNLVFTITGPAPSPITCLDGNNVPLGTLQIEGTATCYFDQGLPDTAAPVAASYAVNVSYAGDFNFAASSANYTQLVVPPAP